MPHNLTEIGRIFYEARGLLLPSLMMADGLTTVGSSGGTDGKSVVATGKSLIFTAASSQYLSITGKTSINQQKFTIAFWFKRGNIAVVEDIYAASDGTLNNIVELQFSNVNKITFQANTAGSGVTEGQSTAITDTTTWHHFMVAVDTTQVTAANRVIGYLDGSILTGWLSGNPPQNTNLSNNFASPYFIGQFETSAYFNGKLAEFYYIDGQQLTPSSFISGTPGNPIAYAGSYTGAFDFYLNFSNDTSTTTLGLDSSGEGNNWTLNNMTTANQSSDYP